MRKETQNPEIQSHARSSTHQLRVIWLPSHGPRDPTVALLAHLRHPAAHEGKPDNGVRVRGAFTPPVDAQVRRTAFSCVLDLAWLTSLEVMAMQDLPS